MVHSATDTDMAADAITVSVENVGGIEQTDVTIDPGVTVLRGRNATNRTSFLSAVDSALGGTAGSIKTDADTGSVALQIGDQRYERTFRRDGEDVHVDGEPYVADGSLVETFVTLLENNPARRAVERGGDLREIIMRPIDTDEIERRIESLQREKRQLDDRIDRVGERKDELPALEDRRQSLQADVESIDDEIATLRTEIDAYEADHETAAEADSLVEELDEARQEHNRVENEIEVVEAEIESLEGELAELTGTDEGVEYTDEDLEQVKEDLAVARERRRQLEETINALFTIVEFNQDLLDGSLELPGIEPTDSDPTSELAPDDERDLVCWTCGSPVTRNDVDVRLDSLRAVIEQKRAERTDVTSRVETLEDERETIETTLDEQDRIERERSSLRKRLNQRRERRSTLESRQSELADTIADLEREVADTQQLRDDDLLEMYERLSDLQYERGQLNQQLEDVTDDIESIQALPAVADLNEQRSELRDQIAEQRARIDRLEQRAVETFNQHMDELLDVLGYDNITRVWIEKRSSQASPAADSSFNLHVIRESADGVGYEETIDNLSESERELIGLVFALAGYLTHEVYEDVPFILLDSLEAIDAERTSKLVDHFSEYVDVLLVALLPEDAQAVADRHDRIPAEALQ
ncbi:archaea-specific SMC-related protein [Halorhabdus sp. CBA1104]|uniref:archaea-specific SMC-related protein n=1 Tax=Halorhabdus sp. CBA1104 TaxID=1380432 RepID=UPI0018A6AB81|nr:archaea-specific SMC-related protein [Halorhabdus sp. CBA1104]